MSLTVFVLSASPGPFPRPTDVSSHSSSGSFHSSREPLGVHNYWSDKPAGRGTSSHRNQNQHHPSNTESYWENGQRVHGGELQSLSKPKPSIAKEKSLRNVLPPLCASRLKPIRQKTKNAVVRQTKPLVIPLSLFT